MQKIYQLVLLILLKTINISLRGQDQYLPKFIWNFGLIANSNYGINKDLSSLLLDQKKLFDPQAYLNTKSGDILWVQCRMLSRFYHEVLPSIKHPFILLICHGTDTFPYECGDNFNIENLLNHNLLIHVFAQNNAYIGPSKKISHIPIGMDFHSAAYRPGGHFGESGSPKEQEFVLNRILNNLKPTYTRKKKAFVDFQLHDTMERHFESLGENRTTIFQQLLKTNLIDYGSQMRRSDLWKIKGEYAFSVSPHGRGLDCHRTWEDLILGCIVIVKTSPLDPLYTDLPVVIVKDWAEITSKNLDLWLKKYQDAFDNPRYKEKLTTAYWVNKMELQRISTLPTMKTTTSIEQ